MTVVRFLVALALVWIVAAGAYYGLNGRPVMLLLCLAFPLIPVVGGDE